MKKIVPVIAMFIISVTACHKEKKVLGCTDPNAINYNLSANTNDGTCQYCPISHDTCAAYNDTTLAYQLILGKWYLRRTGVIYPHGSYSLCYDNSSDYLEFLANRTVNIRDSTGSVRTITYEFGIDDSFPEMFNKFRLLDSIRSPVPNEERVEVCDGSVTITRWGWQTAFWSSYVK